MDKPAITRFENDGPAGSGLQPWFTIDPASIEAGKPVQRVHIYDEDDAAEYMTGVWDCTAMTGKFEPYPVNELMLLLEGSLTMITADGKETVINSGEAFVLPKGLPCQWKQEGYLRKFFVIFGNPGGPGHDSGDSPSVILPQPQGPAGGLAAVEIDDPSAFLGEVPQQHRHVYFTDKSGQMTVAVWDSTPFETAVAPFPRNEYMHLLEGSVTLTDGDGVEHQFQTGDSFYVPIGAECGWKSTGYVRKLYAIYQPAT